MTAEAARLPEAEASLGDIPLFEGSGKALWQQACERVQSGDGDDRQLYWQRLKSSSADPGFESGSRNYFPEFSVDVDRRVLVSGFDPFNLNSHIEQSNPSGVIALSLDGIRLKTARGTIEFRSLVMPVRFRDFDEGLVESLVAGSVDDIDMMITVSMGRDAFDLERFPGLRRSSGKPDNEGVLCGGVPDGPIVPPGLGGPEFVEFSLPVGGMQVEGDYAIRDNRHVTTLEQGETAADSLDALKGLTAVQGSGGGYLSNEISYRAIRAIADRVPVGHIHTPSIAGFDREKIGRITGQGRQLIMAAAGSFRRIRS